MIGKTIYRNAQGVRIYFENGHPVVKCGKNRFFPHAWDLDRWVFAQGPVREIQIHETNDDTVFVIVWR